MRLHVEQPEIRDVLLQDMNLPICSVSPQCHAHARGIASHQIDEAASRLLLSCPSQRELLRDDPSPVLRHIGSI